MRPWKLLLPLLVLAPAPAWALKPQKHRDLAEAACNAVRLPDTFCRRMGQAVYETDYREWDDLSAHAQTPRGADRCTAADASAARLDQLARSIVASARSKDLETAAVDLGRAIHTLQDECAHHGMTNEEHAFYSLDQTCSGDEVSPDIQPAALSCADQRTRAVMTVVAAALAGTDWSAVSALCRNPSAMHGNSQDSCAMASLPTPVQACEFLALYKDWDGGDSTWNGELVGAALVRVFESALGGEQASRSVCRGDVHAIDPQPALPDVVNHDVTCGLTDITCLGKVDEGGTASSPYGEDPPSGGCATSGGAGLLVGLAALLARRRRP